MPALIRALRHPDSETAYSASQALAIISLEDKSVVPEVARLLASDFSSPAADYACETLTEIGRDAVEARKGERI